MSITVFPAKITVTINVTQTVQHMVICLPRVTINCLDSTTQWRSVWRTQHYLWSP